MAEGRYTLLMAGKQIALYGAALAVLVFAIFFFWDRTPDFETARVERAAIVSEVSASGNVEPSEEIEMHFRGSGILESRSVSMGVSVVAGDELARQDIAQLEAQLAEMQAGVDVQKARLAQLLAGAAVEDIGVARSNAANARDALREALYDAYAKADDAVRTRGDAVFYDPYASTPQLKFSVNDLYVESKPEAQRSLVEDELREWNASLAQANGTDPATLAPAALAHLREVTLLLDYLAQALSTDIEGIDATTIETWKASVATARANVSAATSALVAAKDAYASAEGALALKTADARPEDRSLYEAQIRQAEAAMRRVEAQLAETILVAPVSGTVVRTAGQVGEIVGPETSIVTVMPDGALQVRVNVSEGNIVDAAVGQPARIMLDAFGTDVELRGTVVEIELAETVIGGAVYYEAVVAFDAADPRVRRGMSATVWIETAHSPHALVVPASAISQHDGGNYVWVLVDGKKLERLVQLGLTASDGRVEIIEGVGDGDVVVLGERT